MKANVDVTFMGLRFHDDREVATESEAETYFANKQVYYLGYLKKRYPDRYHPNKVDFDFSIEGKA